MGDPASWPQPSGLTPDGSSAFAAAFASARQDDAWWAQAELRTSQLIACIQPTRASEERRQAVADYVQRLIHQCFKCQVVTFGSVPLKTYLPDGDIDLTALSQHGELKETWAEDVHSALRKAEKDSKAEFRVKEVQYIHAEVKIIKCLVENIVVDISFNQTGGLCTLCFLEEVDRCINQNHLFKRSVILVKAWCYYESRILGAHHALISTYALETLVLYVFHVFHTSLRGPLEVLYTFLEYFSNFDWDKYCVSLWGPVPLSSLPGVAAADGAEPPRKNEGALLLTKAFLDTCSETYSVVPTTSDNQTRTFNVKFLNVLDPLRESNNLGRSVSKGNFYRIRSAFGYGARKLAGVLKCSKDNINAEVERFFSSTLERSCSGGRLDAAEPPSREGANHSDWTSDILRGDFEHYLRNLEYGRWCQNPQTPEPMLLPAHMLQQPSANMLQVHQHLQEASQKLNVNITHPHVLGSGPAVLLPSAGWEGMGSYQRHNFTGYGSEEASSKLGGSTSTYLSNHRQSYHHDRQAPSFGRGGNQHGTYRQYDPYGRIVEGNSSFIQGFEKNCSIPGIDCNEVYQMSAPWHHVGPVQEDKAEPQAQNLNAGMSTLLDTQSFETERTLDKTGLQQHVAERRDFLLGPSTSLTPVSVPILPVPTGGVPGGRWPLPHHKNSYWNPTGSVTPGPHAPQAYPHDSSVVHSTDSLEFGSFGPVLFGDMRISSTQLQLTQAYISGTPGTSGLTYSSGDRAQLSSSPKQR
ncbi:unnamed protein product [Sphagnum jensenii]|uniref:Polymerase nucleotidyl transferase domain-containing protein n=1 Tax=Sphagnum jensenii TaxID=128206 RepID=A0ABP0X6T5_9BRYO